MSLYKKILRGLLAASMSVLVVMGTGGILTEKHSCQHCGIDFSLALLSPDRSDADSCCGSTDSDAESSQSCEMKEEACCSYETGSIGISGQLPALNNAEKKIISQSILCIAELIPLFDKAQWVNIYVPPDRQGGRDLVISYSQYRT